MEALERRLAERMVVDFVRPEKAKAEAPIEREPKLAAEIVAREEIVPEVKLAAVDNEVPITVAPPEAKIELEVNLDDLKPPVTISVSKITKFSRKLTGMEL
jgi:type IV secretion system protein VirD4